MRWGETGTRTVTDDARPHVYQRLAERAGRYDEYTTGACVGVDAIAANWFLDTCPDAIHRLVVPANLSQVDWLTIHRFRALEDERHIIEWMPKGTSYRDRNNRVLDHTDELDVIASYPESHGKSRRSGTWMTYRLAKSRGLHVYEPLVLNS